MRWQLADRLREMNWEKANQKQNLVIPQAGFYVKYGKRVIDIAIASCALIISLPVNLVLIVVVFFDLGSPVIFRQKRIGLNERTFQIVKLRTMRDGVDENGKPLLGELRVTRIGRIIRRTSLDELLNFWSIFKGDMSVIGPRPLPPEYLSRYSHRHLQRHQVKPGLECPIWKPLPNAPTYQDQLENDVWYVENVSFLTDLKLMKKVVRNVLDRRQNAARGNSSRGIFMGYDSQGNVISSKEVPENLLDEILERNGINPQIVDS